MRAAAQLMWIYAEYATSDPLLRQLIAEHDLPLSVAQVRSLIEVSPDQATLWLTLRARSTDPRLPPVIVNGLAEALVRMSPAPAELPGDQSQAYIGSQIRQVETDLAGTQERLAAAELGLQGTRDPIVQRSYQEQIAQQRAYAADLRNVLTKLYELYQSSFTNQIEIVETAEAPRAVAANPLLAALLGALAAALAAGGLVLTFAYFDPLIRTPEDMQEALDLPLLGAVVRHKLPKAKPGGRRPAARSGDYLALGEQRL
jgi:capsular polysaccharide biosynthesis protein